MSEQIFWVLIILFAACLSAWEVVQVSRDSRDYRAWGGLVANLALVAFGTACLWGTL